MVRAGTQLLKHEGAEGWERVHLLVGGCSSATAPRWEPYGTSSMFAVAMTSIPGPTPLYVRLPPVAPGEYRLRLDLVHRNHELGEVRVRTATLYAPVRVIPLDGGDG